MQLWSLPMQSPSPGISGDPWITALPHPPQVPKCPLISPDSAQVAPLRSNFLCLGNTTVPHLPPAFSNKSPHFRLPKTDRQTGTDTVYRDSNLRRITFQPGAWSMGWLAMPELTVMGGWDREEVQEERLQVRWTAVQVLVCHLGEPKNIVHA